MLTRRTIISAFLQVKACTGTCLHPGRSLIASVQKAGRGRGKSINT